MGERLVKVTRGFGYWCWKPQVILQSLRQIEDGDILIYADIGCEFVPSKRQDFLDKLKDLENNDIIGRGGRNVMKVWTKNDIFVHFGVENDPEYTDTHETGGCPILMKKTDRTIKIITEWLDVFKNHWNLVDDSPSKTPNAPEFIENRHDQSIWSMINKKHKLKNFECYWQRSEYEFGILDSRKSWDTMGHLFNFDGTLKVNSNANLSITSRTLKRFIRLGGRLMPSKKARIQCRKLKDLFK